MKAHWWSPGFQAVTWVGCFASHRAMAMAPSLHREQMESQLEKEARFRQLMAHSSHDSAIDTDSMEWETEIVEFERETVSFLCMFSARSPDFGCPLAVSQWLVWRFSFSSWGAYASFPCTCSSWVTVDGFLSCVADADTAHRTEREKQGPQG